MENLSFFGNAGMKWEPPPFLGMSELKKIEATSFFGIARFCFDLIATAIDLKLVLFLSCLLYRSSREEETPGLEG